MATRGLDVLERDEPLQALLAIDDEELLDLVRLEDVLRRLEIRARTTRDHVGRHHLALPGDRDSARSAGRGS
jgi:hypothetical protein